MTWYVNGIPVTYLEYERYMKKFEPEEWKQIQETRRRLLEAISKEAA